MRERLKTKEPKYKTKHKVYLMVDGETEKDYFNKINEFFPNISIKSIIGNEDQFDVFYQEHYEQKVYLILDIDNQKNVGKKCRFVNINNIMQKYDINEIVFYNNYSFELWLLNHKTTFIKSILYSHHYDKYIKNNFHVISWSRNKNDSNRKLIMSCINKKEVIEASDRIERANISTNPFNNPSSNMHYLLKILNNINDKNVDEE